MSFHFSRTSEERLATCDERLRRIARHALTLGVIDFGILEGHRGQVAQDEAFRTGKSQKRWPNGNHNSIPSLAMDVRPVLPPGVDLWGAAALPYWYMLAGVIMAAGAQLGMSLRWGGDFDSDRDLTEKGFKDLPHFEVRG